MFDQLFTVRKFGCSKLFDWYSGDWGWFLVVVFWLLFFGLRVKNCIRALLWLWWVVVTGVVVCSAVLELEVVGCGSW